MKITEIKNQSLSTVIANYLECQGCKIVDQNLQRMRKGYKCSICGYVSDSGLLYFNINTHILIDLIQEAYQSSNLETETEKLYEGQGAHDISVIIFFCTLREVLLDNLIKRLMHAQNLSKGVSNRLLSDNKFHIQKQDKLFKALTNVKWDEAILNLTNEKKINYKEIDEFVSSVVKARNDFIHEANKWSINKELATGCMDNLSGLINLYVALHNSYVQPYYKKSITNQSSGPNPPPSASA